MGVHLEIIGTLRFISYTWTLLVCLQMCATDFPAEGESKGLETLLSLNQLTLQSEGEYGWEIYSLTGNIPKKTINKIK